MECFKGVGLSESYETRFNYIKFFLQIFRETLRDGVRLDLDLRQMEDFLKEGLKIFTTFRGNFRGKLDNYENHLT